MSKKRLISLLLPAFFLIAVSASAYVETTIAQYRHMAPCGKLPGVPGILQAMYLIPNGSCAINGDGSCNTAVPTCSTSNNPSKGTNNGKCLTKTANNGKKSCACFAQ